MAWDVLGVVRGIPPESAQVTLTSQLRPCRTRADHVRTGRRGWPPQDRQLDGAEQCNALNSESFRPHSHPCKCGEEARTEDLCKVERPRGMPPNNLRMSRACLMRRPLSEGDSRSRGTMPSGVGLTIGAGPGQGPPRQCSMRWWSGVQPWRTPHRTAWVQGHRASSLGRRAFSAKGL
jgi:hypothetical protein